MDVLNNDYNSQNNNQSVSIENSGHGPIPQGHGGYAPTGGGSASNLHQPFNCVRKP